MDNINMSGNYAAYSPVSADTAVKNTDNSETVKEMATGTGKDSAAVIYEKGTTKNSKVDQATIDRLKAEAEERTRSLRTLVESLISKQGGAFTIANNVKEGGLAAFYRSLEVDDATREQAQKDIADDGYWGIEQTSDRILSFAKGLAGDDKELAGQMLEAIKKGFADAKDEWGEELPELSQKTMETTLKKVNEWIDGLGKEG